MFEVSMNTVILFAACCSIILMILAVLIFTGGNPEEDEANITNGDKQVAFHFGDVNWFYDETRVNMGIDWLARQWKQDDRPHGDMLEIYYLILFLGDPAVSGNDEILAYNAYIQAVTRAAEYWAYQSTLGADKFARSPLPQLEFEQLPELQALKQGLLMLHKHLHTQNKRFNRLYVLQLVRELEVLPVRPTDREIQEAFLNTIATAERILAEQSV